MIEQYYRPSQIRYLRDDVIWMIREVLTLEVGEWPKEATEGGETSKSPIHCAPFENPVIVRAEVEQRIELTKSDGETLIWEIQVGKVEYYDFLCPAAKRALNYVCSGPKRRKMTYPEWLRNHKTKRVINKIGDLVNITTSKCGNT